MRFCKQGTVVLVVLIAFMLAFGTSTASAAKAAKAKPDKKEQKEEQLDPRFGKVNAAFDASKLSDMSDFDPLTWKGPEGDVIRIAM